MISNVLYICHCCLCLCDISIPLDRFYMTSSLFPMTVLARTLMCNWAIIAHDKFFISTQEPSWIKLINHIVSPNMSQLSPEFGCEARQTGHKFWWWRPGLKFAVHGPTLAPLMGPLYLSRCRHVIHHKSGLSPAIWHAGFGQLLGQVILATRGL